MKWFKKKTNKSEATVVYLTQAARWEAEDYAGVHIPAWAMSGEAREMNKEQVEPTEVKN